MIPETHGGRGELKPRRGLELLHTTPVHVGPPKPATAPVRLPALTPTPPARSATGTVPSIPAVRPPTEVPSNPPMQSAAIARIPPIPSARPAPAAIPSNLTTRPATTPVPAVRPAPIPSNLTTRPATTRIPPPATVGPPLTRGVPIPSFPAAPPASPSFPAGTPHRIVRRLSDTTTNLQALLQSPLGGAQPASPASKLPAVTVIPVQPNSIGPKDPDPSPSAASDDVLEAVVSEILPPVIDPVIPGDIRPSQRVGLRPGGGGDNAPRARLIREQKPKGWLKRLIGE